MRLTLYTDYALRLLMYLALKPGQLATVKEVSEAFGISRTHLMKVAPNLVRGGFVESVRGRGGGVRLKQRPEEIRVGEVVRSTEEAFDGFRIVECFNPERNSCRITGACRLRGVLHEALDAYMNVLDRSTLADLTVPNTPLRNILGITPKPQAAELMGAVVPCNR
ncbi:RrF2 family transcriptional regulator [Aurantimonas sp. NFXS3]|uniref:RrF2 family transcriptional regulator n=1 Tax=Aurantimonas sp. NFXS3 TaxID=2818434 RepID=UPI003B8E2DD3